MSCAQHAVWNCGVPFLNLEAPDELSRSGIVIDHSTAPTEFSPYPALEYFVADSSLVVLILKSVNGETIDTLVNDLHAQGLYRVSWSNECADYPRSLYYFELHVGDYVEERITKCFLTF